MNYNSRGLANRTRLFVQDLRLPDLLLPALLAIVAAIEVYKNLHTELHASAMMSAATAAGADINARVQGFYMTGMAMAVTFVASALLYKRFIGDKLRYRHAVLLNTLSLLTIITTAATAFVSPTWNIVSKMALGMTLVTALWLYLVRGRTAINTTWDKVCLSAIAAFVSYILVTDIAHLSGAQLPYQAPHIVILVIYAVSLSLLSVLRPDTFSRVLGGAAPIALIPALYLLSNETIIYLYKHAAVAVNAKLVYGLLFVLLLAVAAILSWKAKAVDKRCTFNIGLCLLGGIACTVFYSSTLTELPHDEFETANQANAAMSIFAFGKVPLLDFFTSHLFNDQAAALLYFSIFGYNASFDYAVYDLIFQLIGLVGCYLVISRLFPGKWHALFYVLFLPFVVPAQFPTAFALGCFCYYFFTRFVARRTLTSFLGLAAVAVFTLFWRIDIAVCALPALAVVLALWALIERRWQQLVKYVVIACVCCIVTGLIVAGIFHSRIVMGNFASALSYIGASQAHGLPEVFNAPTFVINTHFFLLPALVIALAVLATLLYLKGKVKRNDMLAMVFFSVIYLLNFNRGVVRHTITYGEAEYYLASYQYLLIPFGVLLILGLRRNRYYAFMLCSMMVVFAFKYPNRGDGTILISSAAEQATQRQFATKHDATALRVPLFNDLKAKYQELDLFMTKNFSRQATLLDMSNSPMLYYHLQRPVPGYFCQYMQNMVTAPIQEQAISLLQKYDVPVAVFSSYPRHSFFDQTDGVPNPLRYYIMSNYIYNYYHPQGVVSGKYMWVRNDVTPSYNNVDILADSEIYKPEIYEMGKAALMWANYKGSSGGGSSILSKIADGSWALPTTVNKIKGNYVIATIMNATGAAQSVKVTYRSGDSTQGGFIFTAAADSRGVQYLIPVSVQYNWHCHNISSLEFSAQDAKVHVQSVSLFNGL